jgi:hypothetical protein
MWIASITGAWPAAYYWQGSQVNRYARDRGRGTCVMSVQQLAAYGLGQVARAFIIDQTFRIEILTSEAVKPQFA